MTLKVGSMLHHISITAQEPLHVAGVLTELFGIGKVIPVWIAIIAFIGLIATLLAWAIQYLISYYAEKTAKAMTGSLSSHLDKLLEQKNQ